MAAVSSPIKRSYTAPPVSGDTAFLPNPSLLVIARVNTVVCLEDHCAWWDFGGNECVMATAAAALGEVAANLEDMQQKTAASDSNTDSGKRA